MALTSPSLCVTHERSSGPSLTAGSVVRSARSVLRPPPTPTRLATTSRLNTGYRTRHFQQHHTAGCRAGEGLPSSRRHPLNVPRPLRRGVPHGCASRLFTASMAFTLITGARHSLAPPSRAGTVTTPQASRHATDRIVAPPYRALDAG